MRIPLSACALMRRRVKPSSPAWVSSTWRSSLIGYCASSRWTLTWDVRRSLIESLFVTVLRRLQRDSSGRRVELVDGTFHEVDSSEIAFRVREFSVIDDANRRARPILLEPIEEVEVVV